MLSYFSLQITKEIHEPHSKKFLPKLLISVIYSLKCLLLSCFSTNQTHLSYFSFQLAFSFHTNLNLVHVLILVSSFHSSSIVLSLFHTNLNLVHVLVLVSSFCSSSIVLSLFHTNLNLVHVLVLVSSFHSSSIVLSLFHTNLNLVHVLILVSSFHSSSIVLTVHFFLGLRLHFKHNIDLS